MPAQMRLQLKTGRYHSSTSGARTVRDHVGALIIRIGFWGPLYYNYNKEPAN